MKLSWGPLHEKMVEGLSPEQQRYVACCLSSWRVPRGHHVWLRPIIQRAIKKAKEQLP